MAVDRTIIFSILDIKGFDDGDIVYHEPIDYDPKLVAIDGDLANGKQRLIGLVKITGIPDETAEYAKRNITKGLWRVVLTASTLLDNEGDGSYVLSEEPVLTQIERRRFKLAKAALIAQIPGATSLINDIYNPDLTHPKPGGEWPSITWDNLGACFWDKFAQELATKTTMETDGA